MSRSRTPTEQERIEGLGECLSEALDHKGLYEITSDREMKQVVKILSRMISALVIHRWTLRGDDATLYAEAEPWILGAIEYALAGRAIDHGDFWAVPCVVN